MRIFTNMHQSTCQCSNIVTACIVYVKCIIHQRYRIASTVVSQNPYKNDRTYPDSV